LVEDAAPDAGPLGGICGCLEALESDLLVVLAIDLPGMTASYLRALLARCDSIQGAVPRRESFSEPLAAFYPKAMLGLAREHLAAGKWALQDWVAAGAAAGLVGAVSVEGPDVALFKNVNSPGDLA
jgi:molybdopterin-guanine dinucleotide biosynthesis protein A